jgi:hypothetical protein
MVPASMAAVSSASDTSSPRSGERVEVRQGSVPDPELVVMGDAESFLAVASGRLSPEEAVQSGALRDRPLRERGREPRRKGQPGNFRERQLREIHHPA